MKPSFVRKILPLQSKPLEYPRPVRVGNFCPNCKHGIEVAAVDEPQPPCQWCGWPMSAEERAAKTRAAHTMMIARQIAARQVT